MENSSPTKRVTFVGNCQVAALASLYKSFVSPETGEEILYVPSYEEVDASDRQKIHDSDLVIRQILDFEQKIGGIESKGKIHLFPHVTGAFLWPYTGQPHPKNQKFDFFDPAGPYPAELGDSFLSKMILEDIDPDEAVRRYAETDVATVRRLDRLFDIVLEKQRSRDQACGYAFADIIASEYKKQNLFKSPNHPEQSFALVMAISLFQNIGVSDALISRIRREQPDVPFPSTETPIHPAVIEHFGLSFINSDSTYRYFEEGSFSFVEFAGRYMRFEWSQDLARGLHLVRSGEAEEAIPFLEAGVAECPRSSIGRTVLGDLLLSKGRVQEALTLAKEAAVLEPSNKVLAEKAEALDARIQGNAEVGEILSTEILNIEFGHEGNSHQFVGEGWSSPEQGSTWTMGPRAALHIGKLDPNYDHSLIMHVHPFTSAKRPFQRVKISLNSTRIASLEIEKPDEIRIWVPSEEIGLFGDDDVSLVLNLPDAVRPADVDPLSGDERPLGLSFRSLRVERICDSSTLDKKILMEAAQKTESLGVNCEFGLVQRLVGVEPLSLLRFSTSRLGSLMRALEQGFDGLGSPENMKMDVHGDRDNAQWMVIDQRYGFVFHTDTHPGKVSEEEIRKRESRRLPWLAQKLLRDLRGAEKIFVYQGDDMTSVGKAGELLSMLRSFGPNRLLAILVDAKRAGAVESHGDGLYIGYIDRLEQLAVRDTISVSVWRKILLNLYKTADI